VALFGALLTTNISAQLALRAPPDLHGVHQSVDIGKLQAMALSQAAPPEVRAKSPPVSPAMLEATRESFAVAIVDLFEVSLGVLAIAMVIIFFIPAVPMRPRAERMAEAEAARAAAAAAE
jgi:hypothetical protein